MPKPTSPVLEGFEAQQTTAAKTQTQYKPVPMLQSGNKQCVMSRWKPSDEERLAIASGADIFLLAWTFGGLVQPVDMKVAECPQDFGTLAAFLGLEPDAQRKPND